MIRQIQANEYLKRVASMTEVEKLALAKRVGEWLETAPKLLQPCADAPLARMQSVMQVGGEWNDAEQEAFMEGVRLLTPFMAIADTWLPTMIYTKAARRCIFNMIEVLRGNVYKLRVVPQSVPDRVPSKKPALPIKPTTSTQPTDKPKKKVGRPRKMTKEEEEKALSPNPFAPNANKSANEATSSPIIPRPKHIDQYAYLLPERTQIRAAQYGPLMRELERARSNMKLLIDDPHAKPSERERWAKTAVKTDNQIAALRRELDAGWANLVDTGRVVVDDMGMAHIIDPETGLIADPKPVVTAPSDVAQEKPKEQPKPKEKPKPLTPEEKAKRISYLQKWLRDPRATATEDHKKQWEENAHELLHLGGTLSDAMVKTGEYYRANIPRQKK
ncbi:MAG: hypothetical protein MR924_10460 [Prevotella sp.]|nr:hypothetical protein [Prevotella sp.]